MSLRKYKGYNKMYLQKIGNLFFIFFTSKHNISETRQKKILFFQIGNLLNISIEVLWDVILRFELHKEFFLQC